MKSNEHISNPAEFPEFERCLTHGDNPVVKLPTGLENQLIAILKSEKYFRIISSPKYQGSAGWFHLMEELKRSGYVFDGYHSCDPAVLEMFVSNQANDKADKSQLINTQADEEVLRSILSQSSQIDWFKNIVKRCLDLEASDIHIEIRGDKADIRVRRDGILRDVMQTQSRRVLNVISAVYTLLAEDRSRSEVAFNLSSAQSAVIPIKVASKSITLRYQSHPTISGTDVVMRILHNDPQDTNLPTLESLGYTGWQLDKLNDAINASLGGIFIAGITGSGKTTTLSSMLGMLAKDGNRKIISIEDPVEYQIPGVTHFSIQRGLSSEDPFADSMLAFLRMDPDIGMFGEIRDRISGQLANTAIKSGHKLLTTIHATSAIGIISRLASQQIGLLREDICDSEFLSCLIYQTLIPKNCPECSIPSVEIMSVNNLEIYQKLFGIDPAVIKCASETGCPVCRPNGLGIPEGGHAGIKGVKVAAEVVMPDMELLDLLRHGEDIKAREYLRSLQRQETGLDCLKGKPAWAHAILDMSNGLIDPYYFERCFGKPTSLQM
jgi:general secretion pathway protein E